MKQQRALRTYEQTLDAAAAEFIRSGYARTTLAAVVGRTGMTKGALYGHFSSKEALAAALLALGTAACADVLERAAAGAGSPTEALRLGVVGLLRQLGSDVRLRAALRLAVEPAAALDGADRLVGLVGDFVLRQARAARAAGELPAACSPTAAAHFLLALVVGYERLLDTAGLGLDSRALQDSWLILEHFVRTGRRDPPPD
ncbi:TetR family transcriptional regulator [Kitasatospora sp. NPDC088134]|uniref:TetR family transcriptional regulator n=1 Tax=Kitasatospora sp. NPDC088134 TaxID=3364071 RepID=UPI00380843F2